MKRPSVGCNKVQSSKQGAAEANLQEVLLE